MNVYQVISGFGGPILQKDFEDVFEVHKLCLNHLIKSLHSNNYVEGLSLIEFQKRLDEGLDKMHGDFDCSRCDCDDLNEEVDGDFFCEFDWPTSTAPKDFSGLFEESSSSQHVLNKFNKNSGYNGIQIQLFDSESKWITYESGVISEHEGLWNYTWA